MDLHVQTIGVPRQEAGYAIQDIVSEADLTGSSAGISTLRNIVASGTYCGLNMYTVFAETTAELRVGIDQLNNRLSEVAKIAATQGTSRNRREADDIE